MGDMVLGQRLSDLVAAARSARGSSSRSRRRSAPGPPGRSTSGPSSRCRNRSLNMFTLIGLGVSRRVRLQRGRGARARHLPRVVPRRTTARSASTSRPPRVIVTLILLGQVLELRARSATGAAIRKLLGLAPKLRAGGRRRRQREDVPLDAVQRRRSAARAAGREGPGRRRRARGRSHVDESMVTGEPIPVEKERGRQGHRRHDQRHRHARHARREGRRRDAARAHRRDGRRGAAQPRADPEARRRRGRLLRAGRHRDRGRRRSSSGRSSDRSRAWRTRSSTRSRC